MDLERCPWWVPLPPEPWRGDYVCIYLFIVERDLAFLQNPSGFPEVHWQCWGRFPWMAEGIWEWWGNPFPSVNHRSQDRLGRASFCILRYTPRLGVKSGRITESLRLEKTSKVIASNQRGLLLTNALGWKVEETARGHAHAVDHQGLGSTLCQKADSKTEIPTTTHPSPPQSTPPFGGTNLPFFN